MATTSRRVLYLKHHPITTKPVTLQELEDPFNAFNLMIVQPLDHVDKERKLEHANRTAPTEVADIPKKKEIAKRSFRRKCPSPR